MLDEVKLFEEGCKAYYDNIPRYKNPYTASSSSLWFLGWDEASNRQDLFSENQSLKLENAELHESLKSLSLNLVDIIFVLNGIVNEVEKASFFSFSREKMKNHIKNIQELLQEAIKNFINDSSKH